MSKKTIALVGATGSLGGLIARELLALPGVSVRCLVRPASMVRAQPLKDAGALLVEGDLDDTEALATLCRGAYTVISSVQGSYGIIVEGQQRLLAAARAAGVRRFMPSDFSFNLFGMPEGANLMSDWRRAFARIAEDACGAVEVVHVLCGCFLDKDVLFGFLGAIDRNTKTANLWGEGHQPMDFTTYVDTARYTVAAATDDDMVPRYLGVVGEVLTFHELIAAYEAGSGNALTTTRHGTLADLDMYIEQVQQMYPRNRMMTLPLKYWRAMLNGTAKIKVLHNDRYPDLIPMDVAAYVQQERL